MAEARKFSFQYLASKPFPSLELKDHKDKLCKWGMENRLFAQTFSFDEEFKSYLAQQFATDFFLSNDVAKCIKTAGTSGDASYGIALKVTGVELEAIPCTAVSMSMFEKLRDNGIVQENGYIKKCFEEYIENVCIADQLRNVLLNEEADDYHIYNDSEREEFLFRLFTHLCVGGGVCQYEDTVSPYSSLTKLMYKDLVSVQKTPDSQDLHVITQVYKVKVMDDDDIVFPDARDHLNSFAYLLVDPLKRHVTLFHHKFTGGLW
ncbi:C11orf70 [Bugula neritina]|uniref:Cilia- and flagella-associated protein 300 n=1 Tax=Bugula neritina TaxID=10212 RepID=A0A7J7IVV3_BUGNE|nr:C11orf70 [Bugula neritina]